MKPTDIITVLLADDTEVTRRAVRRLLEGNSAIRVVAEASDFEAAIKMTNLYKPMLVVVDIYMPNPANLTPLGIKIGLTQHAARVLAISIWDDDNTKTLATEFGAVELLDKATLGLQLIPALQKLFDVA